MSKALERIEVFRLEVLKELLLECSKNEQEFFWRIMNQYGGSLQDIPLDKRDEAIKLCERTLIKKEKKDG